MNQMQFQKSELENNSDSYLYSKGHAYFVLTVMSILMLFDFLDRQVIAALLPAIKSDWNLSDGQLGLLVAILNVAIALFALPAAILTDRWSRTKSAGIMALLWSFATIACGLANNYWQLLAARFVVGIGEAGYIAPGNSLIAASFPKSKRGTMISIFHAAGPIGSVIGVILGGYIAVNWGWRYAFGLVAGPGLLFAILIFFAKDYPSIKAIRTSADGIGYAYKWLDYVKIVFKKPRILFLFIGTALQFFVVATISNWLPSYFNRYYGLNLSESGIRSGIFVLCSVVGLLLAGKILDKLKSSSNGYADLLPILFSAGSGLFFVSAFFNDPGAVQLIFLYSGAMLMVGVLSPVITQLQDSVEASMHGTSSGAMVLCNNLFGMALGPIVLGVLSDQTNLAYGLQIISLVPFGAAISYIAASRAK